MTRIYLSRVAVAALLNITILGFNQSWAKEYRTQKGLSSFTVSAPAKSIMGQTESVTIILDTESKQIRVEVPVKSFVFANNFDSPEMNDAVYKRFNEHYMRSAEYPLIRYNGEILNLSEINFNKDGIYPIRTKGKLSIARGFQEQEIAGEIKIKNGQISISAEVTVYPYQYKIAIPKYIGKLYLGTVKIMTTADLH